jgi:hypothetical protein
MNGHEQSPSNPEERLRDSLAEIADALADLQQSELIEELEVKRGNLADRLAVLSELIERDGLTLRLEAAVEMLCEDYLDFADVVLRRPA